MTSLVPFFRLFVFALVLGLAANLPIDAQTASDTSAKPKITKADDLPRHTYPVQGSVVDLVTSSDKFAALAAQVRANLETSLPRKS